VYSETVDCSEYGVRVLRSPLLVDTAMVIIMNNISTADSLENDGRIVMRAVPSLDGCLEHINVS
jgi:hypothetical protein